MEYLIWGWLGALILFILIEIATTSLTTIWFAGGALVAFLANVLKAPVWLQIVLFMIVSLVLLIFTRPVMMKVMNDGGIKTNVDSIIGCRAKVIERISNMDNQGAVMVNGQEWTARSEDSAETYEPDDIVEITAVSGVKLIVRKKGGL